MEDDQLAVFYPAWQGFCGPVAEKGNFFCHMTVPTAHMGAVGTLPSKPWTNSIAPKKRLQHYFQRKGCLEFRNRRREEKLTDSWDLWMQTIGEITGGDCGLPRASYGRDGLNSGPYCWYMDMLNYEQTIHLANDRDDEVFIAKHEHHYSPMCPQHLPNLTIPSSPTCPIAPLPIPLNHLTDPMMGKIILSAVSEAYNHDGLLEVDQGTNELPTAPDPALPQLHHE
ncbi:hypothetical protein EDC04DRAFT_2611000 [Pisolithus marmoratus]|nr:hypothetical protein EDC04DRAFT_2611000 [Pisolithus marmoratus]